MHNKLKDFRNFLYLVWKHLNLPNPTPVQFDIADFIQTKEKRIIISAFRGVGKSWVTSCYVCHQLLLNPQIKILVISASKQRADDFSTFTLRLIEEMPVLKHLIPSDKQRKSKVAFDVSSALASHAPSVKSLGITSNITGSRADLVIADDVENGKAKLGIIICGSGNGAAMTANKWKKIRAALCWDKELAILARKHNDANISHHHTCLLHPKLLRKNTFIKRNT